MTFVDTNVFMYAVGGPHPLQSVAQEFFRASVRRGIRLCTSVEVLQELAHTYWRVDRVHVFDAAMAMVRTAEVEVWTLEAEDVLLARQFHEQHPNLSARDLCHLATCRRHGATEIMTFDQSLAAAFAK